jgi:hypothetical protein
MGGTLHSLFAKDVSKLMTLSTLFIVHFKIKFQVVFFFLCVNDNKDVDVKCPQTMRCIFCSNSLVFLVTLILKQEKV